MHHPSDEEFDAFVSGGELADVAAFRRHVGDCAACADRLARQARWEESLHAAVASRPVGRAAAGAWAGAARTWLSAAAALALVGFGMWGVYRQAPEAPTVAPALTSEASSDPPPGSRESLIAGACDLVLAPGDVCRFVVAPPPGSAD